MADKYVGWLVPAKQPAQGQITDNMKRFQDKLKDKYKDGTVYFPNPQFLNGDNSDKNLDKCVQALLTAKDPTFDIFAVAGSTGVDALKGKTQKGIVQVVGGNPTPDGITGYHIDAEGVARKQVKALYDHWPDRKQLTVLYDPTSHTSRKALDAARTAAKELGIKDEDVKQVPAATPAAVSDLLKKNPVVGMFMLCPSGMFYDAGPKQDIMMLVEDANVPAIFPEKEFKAKHSSGYKWYVLGHKIPETYERAADFANDLLHGTVKKGVEAPDMDDDTNT